MDKVRLGKIKIIVNKNGFGALPIQRVSKEEAAKILRKAYDNGIRLFDTARAYTDSEEKMKKIEGCLECGQCKSKCPYGLDTPELLKKNYKDYKEILEGKAI